MRRSFGTNSAYFLARATPLLFLRCWNIALIMSIGASAQSPRRLAVKKRRLLTVPMDVVVGGRRERITSHAASQAIKAERAVSRCASRELVLLHEIR